MFCLTMLVMLLQQSLMVNTNTYTTNGKLVCRSRVSLRLTYSLIVDRPISSGLHLWHIYSSKRSNRLGWGWILRISRCWIIKWISRTHICNVLQMVKRLVGRARSCIGGMMQTTHLLNFYVLNLMLWNARIICCWKWKVVLH